MPLPFRALRHRNYRYYFVGQICSFSGTWMQSTLQSWIVYRLTQSTAWLGVIAFCFQLPAFLLSPLAGVAADHMERRRLMIWVESFGLFQAALLAMLVLRGTIQPWHFAAISVIGGAVQAFELTGRHALVSDLVDPPALSSAIALNSIIVNVSRIAGPAIAGILVSLVSEGWCFALNALSFLAIIWALTRLRLPKHAPKGKLTIQRATQDFRDGLRVARQDPTIRRLLVLATFISFVGFPYLTLLPAIVKSQLDGTASTYSLLVACTGVGAVIGAFTLGSRAPKRGSIEAPLLQYSAAVGFGVCVLSLARDELLAAPAIVLIGFFLMSMFPMMNTYIQSHVEDRFRGRVLSLYTMTFLGAMPLSSLAAGWLADHFGVSQVLLGSGMLLIVVALGLRCFYVLRPLESQGNVPEPPTP